MNHPLFFLNTDLVDGVQTHVVVDSLINGTSSGGVRIVPDLEVDEVRKLAAEMTLKYAFADLPRGGAKCGVRMPLGLSREGRLSILEDVGRRLGAIINAGIYYPGMDMNCGPEELRAIYRGAGIALGNLTDTSFYTAVFVAEAVRASADVLFDDAASPRTVAIEGFGSVASHLLGMLEPERFRIVALSTVQGAVHNPDGFDPVVLREMRKEHGDALVNHVAGDRLEPREALLGLAVDILVPAARVGSIHEGNVGQIRAKCIVPAANAPCTEEALAVLQGNGVQVLPGFVCNAGGVLGSSLFDRGVSKTEVEALAAGPYRAAVAALAQRSLELDCQPTALAARVARNQLRMHREVPASFVQRLTKKLSRRFRYLSRWTHRHAARDCREHFVSLGHQIQAMQVSLADTQANLENPLVSVVMPVYATEKFLAAAVNSVLAQTYRNFELLVLDDGSPGDVSSVLAAFDDPRIRLLHHENRGPAFTRNQGVRESRGSYIAFLDSDDEWMPDKLFRQVELLKARPEIDVVYTQRRTMNEEGLEVEGFTPRLRDGFLLDELYVDNFICMSSSILRREVFDRVGLINEALRMSEDFDFWLRVACGHRFAAIDAPLVRYRIHSGQVSRDVEERVRVVWEIRREFDKVFGHLVGARAARRAKALHHCGKGVRAAMAGGGVLAVAPHFFRALCHHPFDVPAWKGLGRALLPAGLQKALRSLRRMAKGAGA